MVGMVISLTIRMCILMIHLAITMTILMVWMLLALFCVCTKQRVPRVPRLRLPDII